MDLILLLIIIFFFSTISAQQQYSANSVQSCNNDDSTGPSSAFLYTCNGQDPCKSFLIFKSEKPYDSVSTISQLLSSDPEELARINNASAFTVFPTNKEVIVPVTCSCLGRYYQANTTFTITNHLYKTYSVIANNTFQELATCSSLMRANNHSQFDLVPGMTLQVPLRCACPTKSQTRIGTKYLLTYLVTWGDRIPNISQRFNASTASVLEANNLGPNTVIFPFTTLLIPMPTKPSSSQTVIQNQQQNMPLVPKPTSGLGNGKARTKLRLWIGIAAGCVVLVLGVILSTIFLLCKRRKELLPRIDSKRMLSKDLRVEIASFEQNLKVYKFSELKKATASFSSKNRVKGSLYRGQFGGEVLAVKRTSVDVSKEVSILNTLNHFNLIKVEGVCENRGSYYLVFEYLQNGSLRQWLGKNRSEEGQRSSRKRIQIALDIANGLHYLHSFTKPAYVHKDIKSSNILLDANLRAKISNFSLARSTEGEIRGDFQTSLLVGTRGYMAPEYAESGQVSPMIDVYAFGVVMLELTTGKRVVLKQDGKEVLLAATMIMIMQKDDPEAELASFLDPSFQGNEESEFAIRVAKLSIACLAKDPASRPSMAELVSALSIIYADMQKLGY